MVVLARGFSVVPFPLLGLSFLGWPGNIGVYRGATVELLLGYYALGKKITGTRGGSSLGSWVSLRARVFSRRDSDVVECRSGEVCSHGCTGVLPSHRGGARATGPCVSDFVTHTGYTIGGARGAQSRTRDPILGYVRRPPAE